MYKRRQNLIRTVVGIVFIVAASAAFYIWLGMLLLKSRAEAQTTATVVVNRLGDVVECDESARRVLGKDLLAKDVFGEVQPQTRKAAREQFTRAWDGPPYTMPRMSLDGGVRVTFERQGNVCVATLTKG